VSAKPWKPRYKSVALGGTFDVFHYGHRQLLSHAFELGEKVLIGITGDQLVRTLGKAHPVQKYSSRVRQVRRFLKDRGWIRRGEIHLLADPFGPAASRKNLEAVIVTPRTLPNARRLNRERRKKGLKPLKIQAITLADAQDGTPISSTRIRNGEIDRHGRILCGDSRSIPRIRKTRLGSTSD
jgi:pantetheine-phosphate adenylyltransferase